MLQQRVLLRQHLHHLHRQDQQVCTVIWFFTSNGKVICREIIWLRSMFTFQLFEGQSPTTEALTPPTPPSPTRNQVQDESELSTQNQWFKCRQNDRSVTQTIFLVDWIKTNSFFQAFQIYWCDKSLSHYQFSEVKKKMFPEARSV